MLLRQDIALTTVLASLTNVIRPALGEGAKTATEHVDLAVALLRLIQEREPLQFAFDVDELKRLVRFADALANCGAAESVRSVASALRAAQHDGADVVERAGASPAEVRAMTRHLRNVCADATSALFEDSAIDGAGLKACVLAHAAEQLLTDRALLASQGWEPYPEDVPPIETLLAAK